MSKGVNENTVKIGTLDKFKQYTNLRKTPRRLKNQENI